jgi:antitoxin ParD1/3/4
MPTRTTLNVSLTPELEKFIQSRVATGRYQTASEVIREGLRLLQLLERDRDEAFKALKAKLKRGAEQAERGEFVEPEEVLKKIDKLRAQHTVQA